MSATKQKLGVGLYAMGALSVGLIIMALLSRPLPDEFSTPPPQEWPR